MPRVLHLIHSLSRGGIEVWLLSMLRAVSRAECEMDVCCKGADVGPLAGIAEECGSRVFCCPLGPGHVSFIRGLRRILREGRYDVLHCHLDVYSGLAVAIGRSVGVRTIASFHNTRFDPQTSLTKLPVVSQLRWLYGELSMAYALRRADLVTGCSSAVLDTLDPRGRLPTGRARVLHYGVPSPLPATASARAEFRRSFGWADDTPVLLHVGRFLEQKNHAGLLTIFQRVLDRVPNARLLLVGDGLLRPTLEQRIAAAGLADRVRLLGLRDDVPALMSWSDVFVFPSLYEGFGLVAVEAAAAGLPVVGSRIPGLTEAVRDGENGLLHDVNDLDTMADSVVEIVTQPEKARRFAEAGRAWVESTFSVQASARRLLDSYREVLSDGERSREPALSRS